VTNGLSNWTYKSESGFAFFEGVKAKIIFCVTVYTDYFIWQVVYEIACYIYIILFLEKLT